MSLPRLFVTGGAGLVGSAVVAAAASADPPPFAIHASRHATPPPPPVEDRATWHALDVTDAAAVAACLAAVRPAVVVHAAIATDASGLEAVALAGAVHVACAAGAIGARLVHLSTDMVFDGASGPYDEDAPPAPITDYGRAKARAEAAVRAAHPGAILVRLPLLYRMDPPDRALAAWIAAAREGRAHPLFVDEIRRPAHVPDVARALVTLAAMLAGRPGAPAGAVPPVVHLPGPVALSRHALGVGILESLGLPAALAASGRSADAPTPRPRELDLVAARTPAVLLEGLRSPAEVFSARRRARPPAGRPAGR